MRDLAQNAGREGPTTLPVTLDGVTYEARGKRLVDGITLTLFSGALSCIMGPNGAGKSLLLRLVAGLIRPTGGTIGYDGAAAPGKNRVALVFQRPVLLRRSVTANLEHALATYGVQRADRRARIAELLAGAQLTGLADRPARVLSGGEQQRLAMVRALAARPDLLLLDEPTASLDPQATAMIEAMVREAATAGIKVVLVTHDRDQARRLADEVVFLHHGRVAEQAPAFRFFDGPQSPEANAYLSGRLLS